MQCKYCNAAIPAAFQRSGAPSRKRVCVNCRHRSIERQKATAKTTRHAEAEVRYTACYHCLCPLTLLKKANGKEEARRVCVRCKEDKKLDAPTVSERKKASVRAWVEKNRERMRQYQRDYRKANADRPCMNRKKLLIEDVQLVREAMRAYYDRAKGRVS